MSPEPGVRIEVAFTLNGSPVRINVDPAERLLDALRYGLRLTGIGLAIGLLGTLGTARLIGSLLVNVRATDPVTLIGVALVLAIVAGLASWIPARRAMAVSPTEALRGG